MRFLPGLFIICSVFSQTSFATESRMNVFVSILPQKYFIERVGMEHVSVNVMVGPGQNPATYEPTPQQMALLTATDVYFTINVPFESVWIEKIKQNNPSLIVVDSTASVALLDHGRDHHQQQDPHVWTSPENIIQMLDTISETFIQLDSENKASYLEASRLFTTELAQLDLDIAEKTRDIKNRDLIVSHPSWTYFANRYGFRQHSIELRGKELQAASMAELIDFAKAKAIKAVFVQPQFYRRAAETIANAIGASIYELDPLAYDYVNNLRYVTRTITEGLSYE